MGCETLGAGRRRTRGLLGLGALLAALAVVAVALLPGAGGCSGPEPVSPVFHATEARSRRLMALAAEEAGRIADPDTRLTRQLNLADLQIGRGWADDVRKSLAAARATLTAPDAARLNEQSRLGGWVSISELSRRIDDKAAAAAATDAAVAELNRIEGPARRCEYVMGVANELQYARGKAAAADLLARAGPWTKSIDNVASRRQALIAFATALFNLDDFDAGRAMLAREDDPAWRSDVLAGMAETGPSQEHAANFASRSPATDQRAEAFTPPAAAGASPPAPSAGVPPPGTQPFYGKPLGYEQVFKNRKASQARGE